MRDSEGSCASTRARRCPSLRESELASNGYAAVVVSKANGFRDVENRHSTVLTNLCAPQADKYDQVLILAKAGDVVFFNGHILHRSKANLTKDRPRRSFVGHYCNARSFTQWGDDDEAEVIRDASTKMTNGSHILARGDTHLPFALPRFGTDCAATLPIEQRRLQGEYAAHMIALSGDGLMGCAIADPGLKDDDEELAMRPATGQSEYVSDSI